MIYDKEVRSDINEGCDKLEALRDAVGELRGDSNDIVYCLLNTGVDTGSVGGCGGGGAGVGKVGRQTTAAHEVGHALGRQHAPCDNLTRCGEPNNPDADYPDYSGYDSDSIGEYGFDPGGSYGSVIQPGIAHDFMGYSDDKWVSPYTFKALMSRIPVEFDGPGTTSPADGRGMPADVHSRRGRMSDREWIPVKTPHLFLRIEIPRDRQVRFDVAFHFDSLPRVTPTTRRTSWSSCKTRTGMCFEAPAYTQIRQAVGVGRSRGGRSVSGRRSPSIRRHGHSCCMRRTR